MEPLEVLFEPDGLPAADLPDELATLYGGPLGFEEPRVFTNFVATIDGVVAIPSIPKSNALVAGDSEPDRFVMGLLRAFADVVLIGAGTLAASPEGTWRPDRVYPAAADAYAELRRRLGKSTEQPTVAVLTGSGSIDPSHPLLASGALVLTSASGAERLEVVLPDASTIVAIGDDTVLDPRAAIQALRERDATLILSEAGPHTFGRLAGAGLVDELFLTVSPLLAGGGEVARYRLAESVELMPPGVREELLGVRRHGDYLFLRYEVGR